MSAAKTPQLNPWGQSRSHFPNNCFRNALKEAHIQPTAINAGVEIRDESNLYGDYPYRLIVNAQSLSGEVSPATREQWLHDLREVIAFYDDYVALVVDCTLVGLNIHEAAFYRARR